MTLENDPNKWKYMDLRFCKEAKQLEAGIGDNDRILDVAKSLNNDVCAPTCPTDLVGKCTCMIKDYNSPETNRVICGREDNGVVFACPERCCGSGDGCPEPGRPDVTNIYSSVATTAISPKDTDDKEDETVKLDYNMLVYGGGFIVFIVLIIILLSFKA